MKEIFNEDFVKFLLGFMAIVTLALGIIMITEEVMENDASSAVQVIPATTTTSSTSQ